MIDPTTRIERTLSSDVELAARLSTIEFVLGKVIGHLPDVAKTLLLQLIEELTPDEPISDYQRGAQTSFDAIAASAKK